MAEELAHQAVKDELLDLELDDLPEKYHCIQSLYEFGSNSVYTKIAQDCFNRHMDYFTEIITNGAIEDDPIMKAFTAKKTSLIVSQQTYNFCNIVCNIYISGEERVYEINGTYYYLTVNEKIT